MHLAPGEIAAIDVATFEAIKARSWEANAALWCEAGAATPLRDAMLAEVDAVVARELARDAGAASLADLGCADGSYLARLHRGGFPGALAGIDLCPALVARARIACPDARIEVADLAGDEPLPLSGLGMATCLLTLVEIARYSRVIASAHDMLRPGGLFILTVLDPTVEALRFLEFKRGRPGTQLYDVEGALALGSLFEAQGQTSPAPYFRFLRPFDCYVSALLCQSFDLECVASVRGDGYPFQAQPRAIMLCARKQMIAGEEQADAA